MRKVDLERVIKVSILTRPVGRVQPLNPIAKQYRLGIVSILTRPVGRVQPYIEVIVDEYQSVSILTRPVGRVQLAPPPALRCPKTGFNPHPARRPGATPKPWLRAGN